MSHGSCCYCKHGNFKDDCPWDCIEQVEAELRSKERTEVKLREELNKCRERSEQERALADRLASVIYYMDTPQKQSAIAAYRAARMKNNEQDVEQ